MRARNAITVLLLLAAMSSRARADVVDGPAPCPDGSSSNESHMGTWCEPERCTSDADCAARSGGRCTEWRLCLRAARIPAGGIPRPDEPRPPDHACDVVIDTCAPGGPCDGSSPVPGRLHSVTYTDAAPRCETTRVCVHAEPAPPPASESPPPAAEAPAPAASDGGCTALPGRPARPWLGALALLALRGARHTRASRASREPHR